MSEKISPPIEEKSSIPSSEAATEAAVESAIDEREKDLSPEVIEKINIPPIARGA